MPGVRLVAIACLPLLASGCAFPPVLGAPIYSPCHALGSSGWTAHVERISNGQKQPIYRSFLIVTGSVVVSGGDASLELGPVLKLDAPVQEIMLRTAEPAAIAEQTTVQVRGMFPALKRYGAVDIRCGDGIVGIIKTVPRES
jgi:hypothetical protein